MNSPRLQELFFLKSFFFFSGFLLLCSYCQALCTPRAAKVEANEFAIIATGNINFALSSIQKRRGAKRDNGKTSNLPGQRSATCWGSAQASGTSPGSCSPRDCSEGHGSSSLPGSLRPPSPTAASYPPPARGISPTNIHLLGAALKLQTEAVVMGGTPHPLS